MAGGMVTWFVVLLLTRNFIAASAAAAVGAVIGGLSFKLFMKR
jgi:hypothetical protein